MNTKQLKEVREWAQAMSYSPREPPWTWQRYRDLVATIDEILGSQAATIALEAGHALAGNNPGTPLGANVVSIESARRRPALRLIHLSR